ncbi:hypothetical protein [Pseudomonas syringae]|uniref:hypothetical protein n=1 Tax=Pseudomonas syringae TaxID=317 RepID=UPI001F0D3C93|nr:hypothetical protein [Pseudomonas syringae]MCH5510018.1 hypothetical protein [Pseudomonas syringae pv. syringae]MCH5638728.1 hypothetical protein [Pseudomonas syringae pv. syringae]MCH7428085.1 hypothetical protein [Pseudomonas syringae pv. syringae]
MNFWEWEDLEQLLGSDMTSFAENPLIPCDSELLLHRLEDQSLELVSTSSLNYSFGDESARALGEVYKNENSFRFETRYSFGVVEGVAQKLVTIKNGITEIRFSLQKIKTCSERDTPIHYSIDWIQNIPDNYPWPDMYSETSKTIVERHFRGLPSVTLKSERSKESHNTSAIRLKIYGFDVILGTKQKPKQLKNVKSGYIIYFGNPDEDTRKLIRDSISFALGTMLVYLGNSSFDQNQNWREREAVSPHTLGGRVWQLVSAPPAPICDKSSILDKSKIERLANALSYYADKTDLQQILWRIWYARTAPYYMAPAYYGALIETIQRKVTSDPKAKISRTILNKAAYKKAKKFLSRYLNKQNLDKTATKLLQSKIDSGNLAPQKILSERFYSRLSLDLGSIELSAWDRRNDAAHGNPIPSGSEIDLIRETKVLAVMLNRIMLKMTSGSDEYIDYFTLNHPIRLLKSPIGDEHN